MAEQSVTGNGNGGWPLVGCGRLFRAFAIAKDPRKLFVGGIGIVLVVVIGVWSEIPFRHNGIPPEEVAEQMRLGPALDDGLWFNSEASADGRDIASDLPAIDLINRSITEPVETTIRITTNWTLVAAPLWDVLDPGWRIVLGTDTWSGSLVAWIRLLGALAVWSVFGGAISRMAAVELAGGEPISIRNALSFSSRRLLSFIGAPVMAFAFLGVLWAMCWGGGLIADIPWIGPIVAGLLWFIPLILGFCMALLVIGIAAGWPMMVATISVEGSDGFDGFSRSFSYIFDAPWHYAGYVLVSLVYGSIVIFFAWLVCSMSVALGATAVATGTGTFTMTTESSTPAQENKPAADVEAPENKPAADVEAPENKPATEAIADPGPPENKPAADVEAPENKPAADVESAERTVLTIEALKALRPNEIPDTRAVPLIGHVPTVLGGREVPYPLSERGRSQDPSTPELAGMLISWWLILVRLLLVGFVASFFWTSVTIIYQLMRQVDDGTDPDEVWQDDADESDRLGVVGTEQSLPSVENPVSPPDDDDAVEPGAGDGGPGAE